MDDERAAYLALAMTPGIGPARLQTLIDACGSPLGVHSAPFALLCALPGFSRAAATAIGQTSPAAGRALLRHAAELGAAVLTSADGDYPDVLRPIPDPPPVLFALGRLDLLRAPAVAIVGSRNRSAYGVVACRLVAEGAARAGITVVSGMARGIDALAHEAALEAGGGTIGVLGNGLGVVYPAANRALYQRVAVEGLLLSEFPPGERPHRGSFPRRNRIISGLARATVVVEAAAGSGALITAGAALEQGREVLAVPGPITSPTSEGTNRLVRDGAAPLLELADLLVHYPEAGVPCSAPRGPRPLPPSLLPAQRELADLLSEQPTHVDEITDRVGRPVGETLALLSALELAGVAEQRPGRFFLRV